MHRMFIIFFTMICLVPSANCSEEYENMMTKYKACGELSSERLIKGCFAQVYAESDKYLNQEYAKLSQYLNTITSKMHKERLVNTQRMWIKFRDSDCEFYSDGQPIRSNICLSERTIQRLKELEKYNVPYAMGCNGCPW